MTKVLDGSSIKVNGVGLPHDMKSLMQMGLNPAKLAQFDQKSS